MTHPDSSIRRRGLLLAVAAYLLWGLLPVYMHLLRTVPPFQFVSYRVLFSAVLLTVAVIATGRTTATLAVLRSRRAMTALVPTALLIASNWSIYIWAVLDGHVVDASLGYFLNPLLSVVLGVVFLRERLRAMQWLAVALAAGGAAVMAAEGGAGILIALALAASFGVYGLVRKIVEVDALSGLAVETVVLAPLAALYLAFVLGPVFGQDHAIDALLVLSGIVTAAPLLLFAAAARRLPLSTLGLIQFLSPTLQFIEGVTIFGETIRPVHLVTFGLIWTGLAVFVAEGLAAARRTPAMAPQ